MKTNKFILLCVLMSGICLTGCKKDDDINEADRKIVHTILIDPADQYQKVAAKGATISIPIVDVGEGASWYIERLHTYDKGRVFTEWPMIQDPDQQYTPVIEHTINGDWFRISRTNNMSLDIEIAPNNTKKSRELRLYFSCNVTLYSGAILIHQSK